ncbi:MAG: helix-turn-helix domain-containing protein [Bacillota bacterium]
MEFSSQYATKVFMRLTPEKQQTVFNAAAAEFARHGYDAANTNVIARRAGVSVGSLFQYFSTKQSLFLALVDYGTQTLLSPVLDMAREAPDALALFRFMLMQARTFAHTCPDYNRIYLGITAQLPSTMGTLLARRIEERTIACYRRAMRKTQEDAAQESTQDGLLPFVLDNLVLAYQFSFASMYYRERIVAYTGLDPEKDGDALIDALCELAAKMIA